MRKFISMILSAVGILCCVLPTYAADMEKYDNLAKEGNIVNADFSDGDSGWYISGIGDTDASQGFLSLSGDSCDIRVSQTITGLADGAYNFTAYISRSDISGICYLYAKSEGHTMASTSVPVSSQRQKISVTGVEVKDGKCDIGLYLKGSAQVTVDDFEVTAADKTTVPFLKGGEISKLTYVEDKGGKFYYADGTEGDALQIMAKNGFNLARIRLLNDPGKGYGDGTYYLPDGYQTEEDCLKLARRAKDKGMQIEFTFAYSDYWSDGAKQILPHEWQEYITENSLSGEDMYSYIEDMMYSYTKDIMQKLVAQGTQPEFVSIGNEIQCGMFFGEYTSGSEIYDNATLLARFVNSAAKAIREVSPDTKIILHSDNGGKVLSKRKTFVNILKSVDFDVIGVSFYPYYNKDVSINTVVNEFASMINTYDKDVIIMETGYNWNDTCGDGYEGQLCDSGYYQNIYGETKEGQEAFLTELYAKLKQTIGGRCIGDLYWDPVMLYDGGTYVIGWAISEDGDYTQGNVVSNSTIFDFDGVELPAQQAMKYNTNSTDKINIAGKSDLKESQLDLTVNGEKYTVTTDKFGEYIVSVPYPQNSVIEVKTQDQSYTMYAPYDGNLLEESYISKLDLSVDENGSLTFDADYVAGTDAVFQTAVYDGSGILVAISNEKSGVIAEANSYEGYTVKAFLWDSRMRPVCAALERSKED